MNKLILMIAIAMTTALSANYIDKRKERARQWYKSKVAKVKGKKRNYQRYLEHKLKNVGRKATKHLEKAAKEIKNDEELRYALYNEIQGKEARLDIPPIISDWVINYSEEQMGFIAKLPFEQQKFLYSKQAYQKLIIGGAQNRFSEKLITQLLDEIPDDLSYFLVKEGATEIMSYLFYFFYCQGYEEDAYKPIFNYIANSSNPDKYIDLFFEATGSLRISAFNSVFAKHPELLSNTRMMQGIKTHIQDSISVKDGALHIYSFGFDSSDEETSQEVIDIVVEHVRSLKGDEPFKAPFFLDKALRKALESEGLIKEAHDIVVDHTLSLEINKPLKLEQSLKWPSLNEQVEKALEEELIKEAHD